MFTTIHLVPSPKNLSTPNLSTLSKISAPSASLPLCGKKPKNPRPTTALNPSHLPENLSTYNLSTLSNRRRPPPVPLNPQMGKYGDAMGTNGDR